mgnify:CR=1 FL=1|jgi:hypothetical protein
MITEFAIIWEKLHSNNVKYLIIGGLAVNIYGYTRNTGDIDILIEDSLENRKNLRQALLEIGIGDIPAIETMLFLPGWTDFSLFFGIRLDVMTSIKGLEDQTFDVLLEKATIVMLNEIPIYFIDYQSLIVAKKATNRLKDQLDLEQLGEIKPEE